VSQTRKSRTGASTTYGDVFEYTKSTPFGSECVEAGHGTL
jgi:hypothetical protein